MKTLRKRFFLLAFGLLFCTGLSARSNYSKISMFAVDLAKYDDGAYVNITATPEDFIIYYLWDANNEDACGGVELDFLDFQYETIEMEDTYTLKRLTLCGNASLYMTSNFFASDEMDYKKDCFVWFSLIDIDDDLYLSISFEGLSYSMILDEYWYDDSTEYVSFKYTRRTGSEREDDYDFDNFIELINLCLSD